MAVTNSIKDIKLKNFNKTVKRTLSSPDADKAFTSFIYDLASPKKKILPVSIGALLKGAKFALTNPVNSYNLVKLASFSDIYLDSNFQKSVLEKSEIWDFLKKHADDLPKIGQILAKAGFREFQEGSFLDQKGLTTLKECFKNDNVLKSIKEIAIELKQDVPDYNKVTSKTLEMLSTDKKFLKFFNEKGKDIADYIRTGATEILPSDYIKAFDDILQKPQGKDIYAKVIKIFNEHPEFK